MKKAIKYIVLSCVLLCVAVHVDARMIASGEKVFINASQSDGVGDWSQANAKLFLYFFQSTSPSNSEWVELSRVTEGSNYFVGTLVPYHLWYDRVSVIRKSGSGSAGNWDDRWNQSCDIEIPDNWEGDYNLLYTFSAKNKLEDNCTVKCKWLYYPVENPSLSSVIAQIEKENVEVCTQSSGDPLSLQPRLISETEGYDYDQDHTWLKWDGEKWIELPNAYNVWGFNGEGSLNETIGPAGSHTYYFLLSMKDHAKQRFIDIAVTKDCSPTCEITDFGVVTSSVNVHDSTYALDGVVAFGDALGKTLRISVTDAKGEHYVDYPAPTTPFIFSLPGLFADGATLTATASFIGGAAECTRNSDPYVAPNAIDGIKTTQINVTHNESKTIGPETAPDPGGGGYKWHDGYTAGYMRTTATYCFDTSFIYTYYELEPKPTASGNLIENGDFHADESYYGTIIRSNDVTGCDISDYNFWGKDVTTNSDFYDEYKDEETKESLFGGFSIVKDANSFWKRYTKKIDAKAGTYYALFDADNSGVKRAWFTNTGKSTQLKLAKGTNYMFSFWVANINNYGEMNNAAILQFAISYKKQDETWSEPEPLGNPTNLNYYQDNIWHQNSHVYVSPVDADEVEIMVRDLNTNKNPGGNDFALDDIRFQPISVLTQAIKHCERFVVNVFEEPVKVNKPEIVYTDPKCGKPNYDIEVTVKYGPLSDKCPKCSYKLQLYYDDEATPVYDSKIDLSTHASEITVPLQLPADGKSHTLTAHVIYTDERGNVKTGKSPVHSFTAPGTPVLTVKDPTVPTPNCDQTTFDLEVEVTCAYLKGTKLQFLWDDVEKNTQTISYGPFNTITVKLSGLTYDGAKHTLLIRTDNTTLDCQDSKEILVPFSPYIYDYVATPKQMGCDIDEYEVVVDFYVSNGQGKTVTVWGKDQMETFAAKEGKNTVTFEKIKTDAADDYFDIWFAEAVGCENKKTAKYVEPVKPHISVTQGPEVGDMGCTLTTYTVKFDITHTNQSGKLYGWIDSNPKQVFSYEDNPATVTFTGVLGDGLEHTLYAEFDGENSCSVEIPHFKAPFTPVISDVKITRNEMKCGETTYKVTVEAVLSDNAVGHKLTVTGDTGKDEPVAYNITGTKFSDEFIVNRDKATGKFYIYFEDADNCESQKTKAYTYDIPKLPILSVNPVVVPPLECDKATFDLDISGTYTYLHGTKLQFLWDGELKAEQPIISLSTEKPVAASLKNLAYDGQKHVLTVQSDESTFDICPFEQKDIDVPFMPGITSIVAKVLPYVCDAPNYQVTVTVEYTNPQGHDLTITDEAGHEKTLKATDPEYDANKASWTFDMPWKDPVEEHTFKTYFAGAEDCKNEDSHKATYTTPQYWSSYSWKNDPTLEETFYICPNSSKYWNGGTYTAEGDYEKILKTVHECDSVVMLHLRYWPTYTWETDPKLEETYYICPNGSKEWNGKIYTEEGDYEKKLQTVHGCDSIVMLHLIFYPIPSLTDRTTDAVVFTENLPYKWEGDEYTVSGDYEATKTTSDGCEYTVYLHLTVTDKPVVPLSDVLKTICPGGSLEWDGGTIYPTEEKNEYTRIIEGTTENYSEKLIVSFYPIPSLADRTTDAVVFTEDLPYKWEGGEYTESGPYETTVTSGDGCTYTVYLNLEVIDKPIVPLPDVLKTICPGGSLEWDGGTIYPTENNNEFTRIIPGATENYSEKLIVSFYPVPTTEEATTTETVFTEDLPFVWNDEQFYTSQTNYTKVLKTVNGCEYTATLNLTVSDKPVVPLSDVTTTICPGESVPWDGGIVYPTETNNEFTRIIPGATENYSEKLIVSFFPVPTTEEATTTETVFTEDLPYLWEGNEYTISGNYEATETTSDGCEYTVYLHLTVSDKPVTPLPDVLKTICPGGSLEWDGGTVYPTETNNEFSRIIPGATENYSEKLIVSFFPVPTTEEATTTETVFTEDLPYLWEGKEYTISGNYEATETTSDGCEYPVYLHLTVSDKPVTPLPDVLKTICPGGSLEWDGGTVYPTETNNEFTRIIEGVTENYTEKLIVSFYPVPSVSEATTTETVYTEDLPYLWEGKEYTISGNYEATETTSDGCEYPVYLHLTVSDKPVTPLPDVLKTICPGGSLEWDGGTIYPTETNNEFTRIIEGVTENYSEKLIVSFYPLPTISEATTTETVFTEDLPYLWEGNEYTISGNYEATETTSDGCEYPVYLHLTVSDKPVTPLPDVFKTICPGESLEWDGGTVYPTETNNEFTRIIEGATENYTEKLIVSFFPVPTISEATTTETVYTEDLPYLWEGNEYTISGNYEATETTSDGCEYPVYLYLTVSDKPVTPLPDVFKTICPGESLEWDGGTVYPTETNNEFTRIIEGATENYTEKLIVSFYPLPTISEATTTETVFTEDLPYLWEGKEYTISGNYEATETTSDGCEYTVYLHLTVSDKPVTPLPDVLKTICPGGSLEWDGGTIYPTETNNEFTRIIEGVTENYSEKLIVNFYPVPTIEEATTTETVFTEDLPYLWEGNEYTISGNYEATETTSDGCEYTVYLHLTVSDKPVTPLPDVFKTICPGGSLEWDGGTVYPTETNYEFTRIIEGVTENYTEKLIVSFFPVPTISEATTTETVFTEDLPYLWEGKEYTISGNYEATETTSDGCEYTVYLHLTVSDKPVTPLPDVLKTICPGGSLEWDGGTVYPTETNNEFTRIIEGATENYTEKLIVSFYPVPSVSEATTTETVFVDDLPFVWNEEQFFTSQTGYTKVLQTADGCEYTATLNLTISDKKIIDLPDEHRTICPGTSIDNWYGETLHPTETNYEFTHITPGTEADTRVKLIVDFYDVPSPEPENATFCKGKDFEWQGNTYTQGGDYTVMLQTNEGCEYPATLHLTELQPTDSIEIATIFTGESYTWHGMTFTESTEKKEILTNAAGCDSVCTLKLSVVDKPEIQMTIDSTSCENQPVIFYGNTYNTSGTYETELIPGKGTDPDTIYILNLTVYPTYDMPEEKVSIIDGETYTWNGTDYETEGVYTQKLQTEHGCDSTVTLNLTVKENIVENIAFIIAEQCAGEGLLEIEVQHTGALTDARLTFSADAMQAGFENGTYPIEDDIVTVPYNVRAGIFSVDIDLLFHNRLKHSATEPFTLLYPRTVLEQGWMDAIFVLTHDYNGGYDFTDFQWYKKGKMLVGETGPYLYQPLEVGAEYSAMLTEVSGLRLMTCPLIITEHTDITMYPTVVSRKEMIHVTVSQNARLSIYSPMGEKVSTYSLIHGDTQIAAPGTQGIYLAEVVLESGKRKVIKIMVR